MVFAVTAAALMLAGTPHLPVLQLGPSPRWAESVGPRYLSLADDGRSVRVIGPGDRDWTLDPATKKEIPEPVAPRGFDLVGRQPGLFDLVDATGKRVQTIFDPDFKLDDGTWALSGDRRYLVTSSKSDSSVWSVADGRRVLANVPRVPHEFWAIRGDELLTPGWVNLSEDKHVTRYSGYFDRRDLKTGQELPKLLLPTERDPGGWRTTPDGRHAVTLYGDRLIRVDLEAKAVLPTLPLPKLNAAATDHWKNLAFATSGKEFVVGQHGDVMAFDYPSGHVRWRAALPLPGSPSVDSLAYAPAGDRVYATSSDPSALVALHGATGRVLDRETFAPKSAGPVAEVEPWVALAEFAAGGELVLVTRAGTVELRDLPNRAVRETRLPSGLWVASALTPDGGLLAVLTRSDAALPSRRLHFLDLAAPGWRWISSPEFPSDAGRFDVTPDGRFLSVAQAGLRGAGLTAVYDLATGERRHLVPGPTPDGQTLDPESGRYAPEVSCRVREFLTSDGRYELRYGERIFYVKDTLSGTFVVSADTGDSTYGKTPAIRPRVHLAAATLGGATAIYDTRTWTRLRLIEGGGSVSLAPDGRYLAVLDGGRVTAWSLAGLPRPKPPTGFPAARRKATWEALRGRSEGDQLTKALWFLQHDPRTVPTLARRVAPVPVTPPAVVANWVADLGSADPAVRAAAYGHLVAQGYAARARLTAVSAGRGEQATLATSLLRAAEKPTDGEWDAARAVELLERIASPAAKELLAHYAAGDPAAKLTVEAREALGRLK